MSNDTLFKHFADSSEGMMMGAFAAVPVALLVLVVDRTLGRWMAPRTRCWLWMLVAARLLMPIAPSSPISAQNVWRLLAGESKPTFHHVEQLAFPEAPTTVAEFMASDRTIISQPIDDAATASVTPVGWDWVQIIAISLLLLWLSGVVVVMLRAVIASLRFAWRLRAIPRVDDQAINDIVLRACDLVGVRRCPQIKNVPGLTTPALFGLFRPTLCLPEKTVASFTPAELRMIVIHETMHIRRLDGYLSWLLTAVQAVHWFNPIAWFTIKQIETYREQACDDAVRRFTEPQQRGIYTDLLLRFASGNPAASLGLLGLWFARPAKRLTARIEAFVAAKERRRRLPRLIATALVLMLAVVGLTDAIKVKATASVTAAGPSYLPFTTSDSSPQLMKLTRPTTEIITPTTIEAAHALTRDATVNNDATETIEKEYDLTAALKKIAETRPEADAQQWLLSYLLLPHLKQPVVQKNEDSNRITVSMTQQGHYFFANLLDEVARFGNTWQVTVEPRVFRAQHVENVDGIDWQEAVKFAAPEPAQTLLWSSSESATDDKSLSHSMESVSYEYAPYMALVLNQEQMACVKENFRMDTKFSGSGVPKVTLFSGQRAFFGVEKFFPFVTGVNYIHGEYASAAQPTIAVLPEGTKLDVQTRMINLETLELNCRLTISLIDEIGQVNIPGQDVTVQIPRAKRRSISARCQIRRGETLLIAPNIGKPDGSDQSGYYYAISTDWFADPVEVDGYD